ncbi:sodium:proton antiporter [Agromyces sp. SYSU K20354]|uniref:cation:proton antiporter n=1 Tax=Agromyces cavernae TaxID=2898659 RepID=UPI001E4C1555|nr:sodium:proton antiporter [Agromyces cavernae]MCD2440781.1 sodium:proton antiporter [Agromyces cavernae]
MELLVIAVLALLAIAGAAAIGPKLGVASPLLLVLLGIGVSLLPEVPPFEVDPEWIIAGVLPPLLYSAAVSMPTMEFRRDFTAISGLSVVLVVITSVLLGVLFAWLIPGLGLAMGIALGAILSPTDAVATSIVKRLGVSPRVSAMLDGESLLNDASALVLLRTAIAGAAASVTLWGVVGTFAYSVAVAIVIGAIVGWLNLRLRARVSNPTVNTVISFTMPFIASIPAEQLGASGLVAAVVAGLITGRGAARFLTPQHRLSDVQSWRTVELVLEGAVFLVMGLELAAIVDEVERAHEGVWAAIRIAAIAFVAVILIRAAYVAPLLAALGRRARRGGEFKQMLVDRAGRSPTGPRAPSPAQSERFRTLVRRRVADIDYYLDEALGWREGTIVVWAGMRGVVTLAAAQTLPADTPSRAMLVLIAFVVAVGSLLVQGGTLPWLVRWLLPVRDPGDTLAERRELKQVMRAAAFDELDDDDSLDPRLRATAERMRAAWLTSADEGADDDTGEERDAAEPGGAEQPTPATDAKIGADAADRGHGTSDRVIDAEQVRQLRLRMIHAEREALLDARDEGLFSAAALGAALEELDAEQISIELKGPGAE